ncbi:hypothetical protein HHI36_017313 [Cryptolaemus montrouzieri]|uniref:Uncharacterized protein n=1 Tax=Cryptolaemus montrouzieri TaxID=559131 RepID=A0ABD2NMG2_9CUCU
MDSYRFSVASLSQEISDNESEPLEYQDNGSSDEHVLPHSDNSSCEEEIPQVSAEEEEKKRNHEKGQRNLNE